MADEALDDSQRDEHSQAAEQAEQQAPQPVAESGDPEPSDQVPEQVAGSGEAEPGDQPAPEVASQSTDAMALAPQGEQSSEPPVSEQTASELSAESPAPEATVEEAPASVDESEASEEEDEKPAAPREKPAVPGAHLEVDIVPEGVDPLAPEQPVDPYAIGEYAEIEAVEEGAEELDEGEELTQPISTAAIDLAAGARYRATGKRKTAVARVIVKPGSGSYTINGRPLEQYFPRVTLQRNIRQPLETVGYEERMDVVARLHGSGVSAQADALRHGISRALLEADPNLRGELKRRGFLTRDSRAKERKKAGLKKARKRPQFSKR
jgi:small subunit ribosomal protein S9